MDNTGGENQKDILGMSDEDFLKMQVPSSEPVDPAPVAAGQESAASELVVEPEIKQDDDIVEEPDDTPATPEVAAKVDDPAATPAAKGQDPAAVPGTKEPEKSVPTGSPVEPAAAAPNYEAFFNQVMAPFKANGKQIQLKTPEEAIALMQMGANYTRKMQEIVPHRKVLMMLENNGLLDEGKLSFLIDIQNKNPEAIHKLIKDAGINPLDIDTSTDPTYQPGNHRVADEEVAFKSVLQDLAGSEDGKATLQVINTSWDQASKDLLWKHPEIMATMHQQRENGVYDRIAAEVDRQRLLRTIPDTLPFLHAYKQVGDQMVATGAFADLVSNNASTVDSPAPVATRVVPPKPAVVNNDKANAAAPSKNTPRPAKTFTNPLAMADDEFLKQFANRL